MNGNMRAATYHDCREQHMKLRAASMGIALGILLNWPLFTQAQGTPAAASTGAAPSPVTADYPKDRVGILIRGSDWTPLPGENPFKNRLKHSLAPAFSYGLAPAAMVSDYEGVHAQVQIEPGLPVICICRFYSIPGDPVLVRLHQDPKKNLRELDAGNLHIGAKIEEAEKTDLIPVNVSRPQDMVWIIEPQQSLPPGEYALMLGTQNISIYPFTVAAASPSPPPPEKH
jgi:hypothetical protein